MVDLAGGEKKFEDTLTRFYRCVSCFNGLRESVIIQNRCGI